MVRGCSGVFWRPEVIVLMGGSGQGVDSGVLLRGSSGVARSGWSEAVAVCSVGRK